MMMRQFDKVLQQRSPAPAIAVAGASTDPLKYGFLVTKFLSAQGYTVWPINSQATTVLGLHSYPNVESLPGKPDILCTVTPPAESMRLIDEARGIRCQRIWLQPGSYNSAVLRHAAVSGMLIESQRCIMVVSAQWLGDPSPRHSAA